MRISNNLITSIACYRKHFEFHAVWSQLEIFIRDMSPQDVPYPDAASKLLYDIIKDPSLVKVLVNTKNNQILIEGVDKSPFVLNNVETLELDAIKNESTDDCIRILALFELAGQKITKEHFANTPLSPDCTKDIILTNGYSLKVIDQEYIGLNLELHPIKVDENSPCSSFIGGIEIQPGKFAYGVFSELGLHKVLKPIAQNDMYMLKLSVNDSGVAETLVRNKFDNTLHHMLNVKSFCAIGNDNYAYIAHGRVYCRHNDALEKHIKDSINFLDCPIFIETDNHNIIVTMRDGCVKFINL